MVIGPILTYGSMVWWPRVRYDISRMELNKLHRLACLAITGVITTVKAAVEVLLGLKPLHVIIIWEQKSIINFPSKYRAYQIIKNISRRH